MQGSEKKWPERPLFKEKKKSDGGDRLSFLLDPVGTATTGPNAGQGEKRKEEPEAAPVATATVERKEPVRASEKPSASPARPKPKQPRAKRSQNRSTRRRLSRSRSQQPRGLARVVETVSGVASAFFFGAVFVLFGARS